MEIFAAREIASALRNISRNGLSDEGAKQVSLGIERGLLAIAAAIVYTSPHVANNGKVSFEDFVDSIRIIAK